MEREREDLALPEQPPDRPRVVEEAHEVLATYGWELVGSGTLGTLVWAAATWRGLAALPVWWLVAFLAALVFLYFFPVTRAPKLAREVLRRWDELRVQRALERSGISEDPRLEVAEAMAHRIVRHPAVTQDVRRTAEELVERLQILLTDLRRVEWLARSMTMDDDRRTRSISDLQDVLDARVASILAQLAELHRTVVLRDAAATERALASVQELLADLEAETEVERLLADAEERRGDTPTGLSP
ncbi:MAG: hypothetical protein LJF04_19395 [Gemmatimonadetes bacterium]|nr:hypothetical protein [Gemmatimonadota bacterium]